MIGPDLVQHSNERTEPMRSEFSRRQSPLSAMLDISRVPTPPERLPSAQGPLLASELRQRSNRYAARLSVCAGRRLGIQSAVSSIL